MLAFLRTIGSYLRPYRLQAFLLLIGLLIDVTFDAILPLSLKFIIDDAIIPKNYRLLGLIIGGLIIGAIVTSGVAVGRDYFYARLGAQLINDLRTKLFDHLQHLSLEFYARTPTGDIMARFTTDLAAIENAVTLEFPCGILCLLGLCFGTAILFVMQWKLALLSLIGLPLCFLGPRLLEHRTSTANDVLKTEQASVSTTVQENVGAQSVVKALGLQSSIAEKFRQQMAGYQKAAMRANFLGYLMERTPTIGILAFNLMVICIGSILAYHGVLSIGKLVTFQLVFVSMTDSISGLTSVIPQLMQAASGMRRIEQILQEQPKVADAKSPVELPLPMVEIHFHEVVFSYAHDHLNLDHINLTIPRGQSVAFVGPSGSGKSTIINLLLRFYDPDGGSVTFNGLDLRTVPQASLRSRIGIVFQENFLFNTSIRENLCQGRRDATDGEIEAAAKAAEIHDFIMSLPQGYETVTGERGGRLSGGERQRLAIARALLRDPEILILDEATSAMDTIAEAAINQTISQLARGRTVISVTHRLASVHGADQIFVLDRGRLVEQGRHQQLIALKEVYYSLWEKQSGFSFSHDGLSAEINLEKLQRLPILQELAPDLLSELAGLFVTEQYPRNRVVVHEGDPGDKFFIMARGRVEVLKGVGGNAEKQVNRLEDGDYFGEIALLENVPRMATVRTLAPCVFLTLQRDLFMRFLDRAPHVRSRLEAQISKFLAPTDNP
jgi:ATP-binding cassette subfamily B protein